MLDLLELKAKNIFMYKNLKLDFTIDDSFIFIRGDNGSGKSLIGDILTDVLFDKAIRKHPASSFVGKFGKSGFSSLSLRDSLTNDEYQIRKYRKHSTYGDQVFFYRIDKSGKKYNLSKKKKRETYKVVWKTLKINWETFKNRNFFGQRDTKRFLDVTDSKKADIIIDIQDLEDLQTCKKKSHESMKESKKDEEEITHKIERISLSSSAVKDSLDKLKLSIEEIKSKKERECEDTKKSIKGIEKKILYAKKQTKGADGLRYELSILKVQIEQADAILTQVEETSDALNKIKIALNSYNSSSKRSIGEVKQKRKELEDIIQGSIKTCIYCGAKLTTQREKRLSKKLKSEISDLKKKLKVLKLKIESYKKESAKTRSRLRVLNEKKDNLSPMIRKRENLLKDLRLKEKWEAEIDATNREIKEKKKFLDRLQEEIKNIISDSPIPEMIEQRKKAKTVLKKKKTELSKVKNEKEKHSYAESVFENSMREIFGDFLKELSLWTNSSAQEIFEENIKIIFSPKRETESDRVVDELNVSVKIGNQDLRDARLLSGGERGRVDIATQFGLFSSAESPIQLLWMDEPLEGIEQKGILLVLELLKNKAEEGVKVVMITHQIIPTGMGASLRVTKKNDQSSLK